MASGLVQKKFEGARALSTCRAQKPALRRVLSGTSGVFSMASSSHRVTAR